MTELNKMNESEYEPKGVRCFTAEQVLGTFEWIMQNNEEWDRVDLEYDRITLTRNEGRVYLELVKDDKYYVMYDIDEIGYNGVVLEKEKDRL